jgi:hypothetical protein
MTDQLALALADRHAGQAANLAAGTAVHRDDRGRVETAVAVLARSGQPFTADDVHRRLDEPYDRNLVSSVLGVWAQRGHLREAELRAVPSQSRSRRGSRIRWWVGNG